MSESLSVYWGLFLNSCSPLELSLNYCSHNCGFCFANLNSPNRTADVQQVMGLLANHQERNTFAAYLLREKYPVTISNHVDPFSESNYRIALPIINMLNELEIPIVFQTKGGKGSKEAMESTPPSVWYISIETLDEDIAKRVAPGAPSPNERLQLIEDLRSHGHRVVVGINPAVEEWISDPQELCRVLASVGCEGNWIQPLHLSNQQLQNMSDRSRAGLGEAAIAAGRAYRKHEGNMRIYHALRKWSDYYGTPMYDMGQPNRSDFDRPFNEIYKKRFPIIQDFINHCYDSGKGVNDPIYFSEFADFMMPYLPKGVFPLRNHLGASQFVWFWKEWDKLIPKMMTYEELLRWCWKVNSIVYNPVNSHAFVWAAKQLDPSKYDAANFDTAVAMDTKIRKGTEGQVWEIYTDAEDLPILLFRPQTEKTLVGEWEM